MLKGKMSNFNKTISKHRINQNEQNSGKATRRGYLKLSKKQADLVNIIKDLQKNMQQLKRYHQSLQKPLRVKKSFSINQLSKPLSKPLSKHLSKHSCASRPHLRILKSLSKPYQHNRNQIRSSYGKEIHSNYQKYDNQSMLSFHHGDVDQVRKAYLMVYGKETTNIVDLYAFFRKTAEKSTRILCSMEMSSLPNHQSESNHKLNDINKLNDMNKLNDINKLKDNNKDNNMKKHNGYNKPNNSNKFNDIKNQNEQLLNVIIQDKRQKQNNFSASNHVQKSNSKGTKPSNLKNLTIQEIFKNGSHDLANVYDFVKKRRYSIKNYLIPQRIKQQKQHINIFQPLQSIEKIKNKQNQQIKTKQNQQIKTKSNQQIKTKQNQQIKNKQNQFKALIESPQVKINNEQNVIYFRSKSSKKSQKSSLKASKHKKQIDLNQNIIQQKVEQFKIVNQQINKSLSVNQQLNRSLIMNQQFEKSLIANQQLNQSLIANQQLQKSLMQNQFYSQQDQIFNQLNNKDEKFKKSKYYVQPLILKKKDNSLDGSSISLKSSSRIIQLDFIPLDF